MSQNRIIFLIFIFLSLWLQGCTTVEEVPLSVYEPVKAGVYHKVHKGETIWRIAQAYDVTIEEIIRQNNIPNAAQVEENQLIFIPGADSVKEIIVSLPEENENDFIWPIEGKILSYFGEQRSGQFNSGIGIKGYEGEPVKAARTGKVVFADYLSGYAYTMILDHQDGYYSVYGQNSVLLKKNGDHVSKGEDIARIGKVGNSVYLHFEIRRGDQAYNPLYYLP